ncbi:ABC transporter permease [Glaciibacter superstes]|uniref:ABC transporter permease n=1 Tax=Glaciibacter superstes TaxID=501023 RepID=UPI0003B5472B|nr:ABC transporter permease [Glaciibacter superstes]
MSGINNPASRKRSRLRGGDVLYLGTAGLRARPTRAVLSALGIAIGIAAMIAVVGISSSSQAKLNEQLSTLGTNLLSMQAGKTLFGKDAQLPEDSVNKVAALDGVLRVGSTGRVTGISIYRSNLIDTAASGGLGVDVASLGLPAVVGATFDTGTWLNAASSEYPAVVLGSKAAARLGIVSVGSLVWLGGQQFSVVGVLDPVVLAPELDSTALIGETIAAELFGFDHHPTTIYERSADKLVGQVRSLLPRTVNPAAPDEVDVVRPSDALAAKNAADQAFTGLLLALGSVALLVGGIGVANTMVISVLERRREIGLRRALGATRGHIRAQFLTEALLLSALGGVGGAAIGSAATAMFAVVNGWQAVIPLPVLGAGIGATVVIGAIAGMYPAVRASRTPPTSALGS